MILYNTATWVMAILIVMLLIFIPVAFQQPILPGPQSGNFVGKDYEGRVSDGLKASPGMKATEFK
jgi:hypothetical protein